MSTRRTKRRYAHELYPHPDEWEVRDLATDVPYLYATALGFETWGTGWIDAEPAESMGRTMRLIKSRELAFVADALEQGLTGDEAWKWAQERSNDDTGEWAYERAVHYGVNPLRIKPYPCGPDPTDHAHMESTGDVMGEGIVTFAAGPEDECETCTEPVDEEPA